MAFLNTLDIIENMTFINVHFPVDVEDEMPDFDFELATIFRAIREKSSMAHLTLFMGRQWL